MTGEASDGVDLRIEGTWNARDVASLTGITPGVLLRSAALSGLTDAGRHALLELGVTDVVDLRSKPEIDAQGLDAVPPEIRVHSLPITAGSALSGQNVDAAAMAGFLDLLRQPGFAGTLMADIYREMVTAPGGVTGLAGGLEVIAHAEGAVLVHCSAGKDRTGVLVALACGIAGVDGAGVDADFLHSNLATDAQSAIIPPIPDVDPGMLRELVGPLLGVNLDSLRAAQTVLETGGGVEAFLATAGAPADTGARLRTRLRGPERVAAGGERL